MDVGVRGGKIVGVRGRYQDRVNKGRLGPKGLNSWTVNAHKDRLLYPMIRKNGTLERASWDAAMELIVTKTKDVQKRLTNHGIGFYTSGQLFLEEYYALAMIGKAGLCTLHMDGNTRLCTATAAASMRESFGCDGQPGSYTDIDTTDCIFMVGHNMASTQTVLWSRILDRLDGPQPPKLIVIDPRLSPTARRATIHLAPKIGTNMAVLNGLQQQLFENGWVNEEWCADHVIGLEVLHEKVKTYTPATVEEITGIPAQDLIAAAEIIGKTPSLLSTALQGVYQSNQATASACQVNNINLLRGLIGQPGCGIFQMNGQPTAQNNRETGCDGEFPAFRNFSNKNHMQELANIWNIEYSKIPHWNQPTHIENMLKYIDSNTIQMFWISGTNPLVSLPNLPKVRRLLTKPELFVVCQDIFMTETAQIADVILPAAMWGEKTGCFTNVDRTVHLSHQAIDPPGEAKADLKIFLDYAKRMDFRDKDGQPLMPWSTSEDAFKAFQKMSAGRPCDYSGMSYELLTGGSGIQWPCTKDAPQGTERLFTDGKFFTDIEYCESYGHDLETGAPYTKDQYMNFNPTGKAFLKAAHYIPGLEVPDEEYPYQLSTGRNVFHFHTRSKTGRSKPLQDASPDARLTLSQKDASELGVNAGDMVLLESRRGKIEVSASIGEIAEKQVFIPFHYGYWDSKDGRARAANELTDEQWDPISKQPMFKSGAVRIEKVESRGPQIEIKAQELQSESVKNVAAAKPNAQDVKDTYTRKRFVDDWVETTHYSVDVLIDICDKLIPGLTHDLEIVRGMKIMRRIAGRISESMKPFDKRAERDPENKLPQRDGRKQRTYGDHEASTLRDCLFPQMRQGWNQSFEALVTMRGFNTYVAHVASLVDALEPVAQALWDQDFVDAVGFATTELGRMQAWVKHQIGVRAPQVLIVPAPFEGALDT